jgi:hypothetical protein
MTATDSVQVTVTAASAVTAALTGNYQSVVVKNPTITSGITVWARADGTAAVAEADGCYAVAPGETLVLDNGLSYWSQAYSVIGKGTVTVKPGTPAIVQPYGSSLAGGVTNPGSSVSLILDSTGSLPIIVESND